jgi:hypothetical protein
LQKAQTRHLPVHQLAGEITRQMAWGLPRRS